MANFSCEDCPFKSESKHACRFHKQRLSCKWGYHSKCGRPLDRNHIDGDKANKRFCDMDGYDAAYMTGYYVPQKSANQANVEPVFVCLNCGAIMIGMNAMKCHCNRTKCCKKKLANAMTTRQAMTYIDKKFKENKYLNLTKYDENDFKYSNAWDEYEKEMEKNDNLSTMTPNEKSKMKRNFLSQQFRKEKMKETIKNSENAIVNANINVNVNKKTKVKSRQATIMDMLKSGKRETEKEKEKTRKRKRNEFENGGNDIEMNNKSTNENAKGERNAMRNEDKVQGYSDSKDNDIEMNCKPRKENTRNEDIDLTQIISYFKNDLKILHFENYITFEILNNNGDLAIHFTNDAACRHYHMLKEYFDGFNVLFKNENLWNAITRSLKSDENNKCDKYMIDMMIDDMNKMSESTRKDREMMEPLSKYHGNEEKNEKSRLECLWAVIKRMILSKKENGNFTIKSCLMLDLSIIFYVYATPCVIGERDVSYTIQVGADYDSLEYAQFHFKFFESFFRMYVRAIGYRLNNYQRVSNALFSDLSMLHVFAQWDVQLFHESSNRIASMLNHDRDCSSYLIFRWILYGLNDLFDEIEFNDENIFKVAQLSNDDILNKIASKYFDGNNNDYKRRFYYHCQNDQMWKILKQFAFDESNNENKESILLKMAMILYCFVEKDVTCDKFNKLLFVSKNNKYKMNSILFDRMRKSKLLMYIGISGLFLSIENRLSLRENREAAPRISGRYIRQFIVCYERDSGFDGINILMNMNRVDSGTIEEIMAKWDERAEMEDVNYNLAKYFEKMKSKNRIILQTNMNMQYHVDVGSNSHLSNVNLGAANGSGINVRNSLTNY